MISIFQNIERIEILKGPQSSIYGKNSYSGVINIISKEPNNYQEAKITMDISNYQKEINFTFNNPYY